PTFTLFVAVNETTARHESFPNSCIGLLHPWRAGRLETMVRKKQRCRVHDTAAASLRVPGDLRIPGALLDLVPNVFPLGGTSCGIESSNLTAPVHLQQSIERHPAHQSGMCVGPSFVALLPNAVVVFAPVFANI